MCVCWWNAENSCVYRLYPFNVQSKDRKLLRPALLLFNGDAFHAGTRRYYFSCVFCPLHAKQGQTKTTTDGMEMADCRYHWNINKTWIPAEVSRSKMKNFKSSCSYSHGHSNQYFSKYNSVLYTYYYYLYPVLLVT